MDDHTILAAPIAMALDVPQVRQLGVDASPWLDKSNAGSVGDVDVDGTKMHLKVVFSGKDIQKRDMRVVSIGANGQQSCHGFIKDGAIWLPASYDVSC